MSVQSCNDFKKRRNIARFNPFQIRLKDYFQLLNGSLGVCMWYFPEFHITSWKSDVK